MLTFRLSAIAGAVLLVSLAYAGCSPAANHNVPAGNGNSSAAASAAANANAANTNKGGTGGANANAASPAAKAKPGTGSMEITSTPPGAGITLVPTTAETAGMPMAYGATPAMITGLAPGDYTVNLNRAGYKNFQKEVKVKAGDTVRINASLRK